MRRPLTIFAFCLAMMCNPAHAVNPRVVRLLIPKPKFYGPRSPSPNPFAHPGAVKAIARLLEDRTLSERDDERSNYYFKDPHNAWAPFGIGTPARLGHRDAELVPNMSSVELFTLIDAAVGEYLDEFRAIHGDEAWAQERRQINKDVTESKMALQSGFRSPIVTIYRFPPAEHLARDPYRSIHGSFISPTAAFYAARTRD